jgi:ParB family chromosome partitioning protein
MNQQAPKPSPLGRGLSALFGDADASYAPPRASAGLPASTQSVANASIPQPAAQSAEARSFRRISVSTLEPGAFQPRRHFDEEALKGLADSIRERGVLEPLLVRPIKGREAFEIVAGERRWRAAQLAGVHDVPAIIREMTDREALEFGLIENVQRQDLSPLEEAEGYRRLMDEFQHTQENLAKIIGKSRPHIANMLRILTLPNAVKQMIEKGELTLGHARAIITSPEPLAMAILIAKKGLNVRQAEELAKKYSKGKTSPGSTADGSSAKRIEGPSRSADIMVLERELSRLVGLKIKINAQGKAGSFTVYFSDLDQMDLIVKKLRS